LLDAFREVVAVDFEFIATTGNRPNPVCLVAHELRSGRRFRIWQDQLGPAPPYATGPDVLFVAFYASAELGCHRVLGWPMPRHVLDLFTEFRNRVNGLPAPAGSSLLGALTYFGLDGMGATEKDDMRALILRGGPWSSDERTAILDYCEADVAALGRLLPAMLSRIDLPRALLRGRYMAAAAAMEHNGTPIDVEALALLRQGWEGIQDHLIADIDKDYGVYDGRTFKAERFAALLNRHGLPWPRTETGRLALDDATFRQMAKAHPFISPLRELRSALSDLRLNDLAVGADGRNRTILSAFRSRTGRNQPSNTKYIFGPSVWLRGLIKPPPGHGVAYIDWSQQEFGIAAALSGDTAMQSAYLSGDPYLAFAKQAGAVPADATKASHGAARELFKQCVLAVNTAWRPRASPTGSGSRRSSRAICCARTARCFDHSGTGQTRPSTSPCSTARSPPCSAGACRSARTRTRGRCAISPCRPTAPRCCGSPAAWRPSAGSRSVLPCTTPC
jgi:DNA polymerase-1